ncbi:MAG TPA: hypothetical protein VGC59_01660 [Solirubrobacteraceae bacterium]
MPMLECSHCGTRQYAAASYVTEVRCAVCDGRLARPKSASSTAWRSPSAARRPQENLQPERAAA